VIPQVAGAVFLVPHCQFTLLDGFGDPHDRPGGSATSKALEFARDTPLWFSAKATIGVSIDSITNMERITLFRQSIVARHVMYTGIVEECGRIGAVTDAESGATVRVACGTDDLEPDDSVAVSGVCITAEQVGDGWVEGFLSAETLDRTYPTFWRNTSGTTSRQRVDPGGEATIHGRRPCSWERTFARYTPLTGRRAVKLRSVSDLPSGRLGTRR